MASRDRAHFVVPVEDHIEDISYVSPSSNDLPAIMSLLQRCELPVQDLSRVHLQHFVACRSGERMVGTIGLEPLGEIALLRSLAVTPDFRGRGIGHELWNRAREKAEGLGIRQLYLLTTTAERLFARWGFEPVPRGKVADVVRSTREYSAMCPSSAVVMAIDLGITSRHESG